LPVSGPLEGAQVYQGHHKKKLGEPAALLTLGLLRGGSFCLRRERAAGLATSLLPAPSAFIKGAHSSSMALLSRCPDDLLVMPSREVFLTPFPAACWFFSRPPPPDCIASTWCRRWSSCAHPLGPWWIVSWHGRVLRWRVLGALMLCDEQAGFRTGRLTLEHLFTLHELVGYRRERRERTFLAFSCPPL